MKVLAADVGGTHVRLAGFECGVGRPEPVREEKWRSEEHDGLLPLVRAFLDDEAGRPDAACLAVAGPVSGGTSRLPNLGWEVDEHELSRATGIERLRVVNDFDAIARGVLLLRDDELAVLGPPEGAAGEAGGGGGGSEDRGRPGELLAVVGAGTGLGVATVEPDADPPRVHGSEGGHADFAPITDEEWGLARFLAARHGRASWERVLSGGGLVEIYRYLAERGPAPESDAVRREMGRDDPAAVVSRHGAAGDDPLSRRALELFVTAYGRFTGDAVLTLGARRGVYVAGGIAPQILEPLREGGFLAAFRSKGRMSDYMRRIPVRVVTNTDVGLLGAAALACRCAGGSRDPAVSRPQSH